MIGNLTNETEWITDRTSEHIKSLYAGNISIEVLERATITDNTVLRWLDNIDKIRESLDYYGLTHFSYIEIYSNVPDTTDPYSPVILFDLTPLSGEMDNVVQRMFNLTSSILLVLGIADASVPSTTEFLHYSQVNSFEDALRKICIKLDSFSDPKKSTYCGKLISGGILI